MPCWRALKFFCAQNKLSGRKRQTKISKTHSYFSVEFTLRTFSKATKFFFDSQLISWYASLCLLMTKTFKFFRCSTSTILRFAQRYLYLVVEQVEVSRRLGTPRPLNARSVRRVIRQDNGDPFPNSATTHGNLELQLLKLCFGWVFDVDDRFETILLQKRKTSCLGSVVCSFVISGSKNAISRDESRFSLNSDVRCCLLYRRKNIRFIIKNNRKLDRTASNNLISWRGLSKSYLIRLVLINGTSNAAAYCNQVLRSE